MTKNEILAREIVDRIIQDMESCKIFDEYRWNNLDNWNKWKCEEQWRKIVIECLS